MLIQIQLGFICHALEPIFVIEAWAVVLWIREMQKGEPVAPPPAAPATTAAATAPAAPVAAPAAPAPQAVPATGGKS